MAQETFPRSGTRTLPVSLSAIMAAMKAMKAAKAMKAMKAKRVSKIAKGKRARASVFSGTKEKTTTGLTKTMLHKNKRGKIVSKRATAAGKKAFANIRGWFDAVKAARKELHIKGFVAMGGKTAQGKAFYAKAKAIYAARK